MPNVVTFPEFVTPIQFAQSIFLATFGLVMFTFITSAHDPRLNRTLPYVPTHISVRRFEATRIQNLIILLREYKIQPVQARGLYHMGQRRARVWFAPL